MGAARSRRSGFDDGGKDCTCQGCPEPPFASHTLSDVNHAVIRAGRGGGGKGKGHATTSRAWPSIEEVACGQGRSVR